MKGDPIASLVLLFEKFENTDQRPYFSILSVNGKVPASGDPLASTEGRT